jgi:hypothetical protein
VVHVQISILSSPTIPRTPKRRGLQWLGTRTRARHGNFVGKFNGRINTFSRVWIERGNPVSYRSLFRGRIRAEAAPVMASMIGSRPVAILGAGTQGRRLAYMVRYKSVYSQGKSHKSIIVVKSRRSSQHHRPRPSPAKSRRSRSIAFPLHRRQRDAA